jgi:hypothetical protein
MKKHYFELDKVESITLTYERETHHKWFPIIPASPKTFLGIKYGMNPEIQAGWSEYLDENGNEKYQRDRTKTSYFKDYKWYRVDDVNKKIYSKAHVTIYLSYKHSLGMQFDSTEEAQEYVDSLIEDSEKGFHVIINK